MLSCVWQGVCSALTEMRSPILKTSPCAGVLVTDWQFLPPMTESWPKVFSFFQLVSRDVIVYRVTYNFIITTGVIPVTGIVSIGINSMKNTY